jgi:hypothetical protein
MYIRNTPQHGTGAKRRAAPKGVNSAAKGRCKGRRAPRDPALEDGTGILLALGILERLP